MRLSESEGCGGTVGASRPSPSAARLSRSLLYGRGATGQKVKMNQWPVFIRGLEKQRTSPWASGRRAWNSPADDGGKRQTVCTQNIYQGAREDDHMGSAASFSGCIYTKIQHCGKKVEFIYFQQGSQGVEASFFFRSASTSLHPDWRGPELYAAAFAELATICTFGAPSETH